MRSSVWIGAVVATGCLGCFNHGLHEERPVVAQVGTIPIYLEDFKKELARVRLDADDSGPPPPASEAAQKRALLDDLIERRLLLQEAERHNVTVPSDQVDGAYGKMRAGWKDDEFAAVLKEKDLTPAELKNALRDMLLVRKYLHDYVYARVAVTDLEIDAYVKSHPDVLRVPEQVRARQLVVKTEEQANTILAEIRAGRPFEEAAMKYSLSPDGQSGGDLGFFARGVMPQVFDDVCFTLRPGEVSKVVPSAYGYHLFKVIERRPAVEHTLAEVRDAVESRLRAEKERGAQMDKIKELRANAVVKIKEDRLAQVL